MSEETADAWIGAWASQATRDGVEPGAGYWDAAWRWIIAERHCGRSRKVARRYSDDRRKMGMTRLDVLPTAVAIARMAQLER